MHVQPYREPKDDVTGKVLFSIRVNLQERDKQQIQLF